MPKKPLLPVTHEDRAEADREIGQKRQEVKYDLRDFTVDHIVEQFRDDEFHVPDYQRKNIWHSRHKCRFIESVLLGLPIPMMFFSEMEDGRLEIVDGAQRTFTLEEFLNDDLQLEGLEELPSINDFRFSDLSVAQQRKLRLRALRLVVLDESTTPETRQEIFHRVNTSGVKANPAEIRRGALVGPFMTFVSKCAGEQRFRELCPISESLLDRREDEELVVRFFAYSERYRQFRHDVNRFLDRFVEEYDNMFEEARMSDEFHAMLGFVHRHFPFGFGKSRTAKSTPRVRFEAIAVGVNLALRQRPALVPATSPEHWLRSEVFLKHVTTHASNSGPRLRDRVEYVRDRLLEGGRD